MTGEETQQGSPGLHEPRLSGAPGRPGEQRAEQPPSLTLLPCCAPGPGPSPEPASSGSYWEEGKCTHISLNLSAQASARHQAHILGDRQDVPHPANEALNGM